MVRLGQGWWESEGPISNDLLKATRVGGVQVNGLVYRLNLLDNRGELTLSLQRDLAPSRGDLEVC